MNCFEGMENYVLDLGLTLMAALTVRAPFLNMATGENRCQSASEYK